MIRLTGNADPSRTLITPARRAAALACATALSILACGKGGGAQAPASVTRTVGSAGGVVTLTSAEADLRVTFPAGALAADTQVTLQALPRIGDELARVGLQPIGVAFASPVTVELTLPSTATVLATDVLSLTVGGVKAYLPTTIDAGARRITAQVRYFGLSGGAAPQPQAAARAGASLRAAATAPDDGMLAAEELAILQPTADAVQQAVADLTQSGRFEDAARLQLDIAALVQDGEVPEWQVDAEALLQGAATTVCAGLADAIGEAQAATLQHPGDYQPVARKVVYWEAASQALGADACAGTTWLDVLDAKLAEALAVVQGEVQPPPAAPAGYGPVLDDVRSVEEVGGEANVLGVAAVATETGTRYLQPALAPLRAAAFATSWATGDQSEYLDLLAVFGPSAALSDDAQYAVTAFTVTTKDTSHAVLGTVALGRTEVVGAPVKAGTLAAKVDGTVELAGTVGVLHCPGAATEHLQVTFEGVEVANVAGSGDLLGAGLTLDAATLLSAAGILPADAAQHQLTVRRVGSSCAAAFGIADDALAVVTLDFSGAPPSGLFYGYFADTFTYPCDSGSNEYSYWPPPQDAYMDNTFTLNADGSSSLALCFHRFSGSIEYGLCTDVGYAGTATAAQGGGFTYSASAANGGSASGTWAGDGTWAMTTVVPFMCGGAHEGDPPYFAGTRTLHWVKR